ncbi:unnamed protein product [Psylliodes chrysocephalus]|uniref:DUF4371 domain-containing protein n=1 Tax=Psylliodes chrysocephalus TaxID=3402493 RepID=A0A9P0CK34_9CUCU|nr:unnamed protein product [Psylliodes chrysocephala]
MFVLFASVTSVQVHSYLMPNYTQKYRGEWEKLPEIKGWLEPCTTDYTKAYCKYCKCFINAKLGDIKKHHKSLKHKAAKKPFSSRQQKLNFEPNNKGVTTQQRKEGDIFLFVAAHTSINAIDHLCEINNVSVHRTNCTNLIKNVVGPHFMKDLLFDVGANPYSLIIDESTDVAVLKMLGIVIRYFSTKHLKIVSTFLSLINIENGTAECIVEAIKQLLTKLKLNVQNLQGIGTDNVSVKIGITDDVYA